jgi:SAM-dependent methyltransferase
MENDLPEHARRNRAAWDRWAADDARRAPRAWAQAEPTWGIFKVPEAARLLRPGGRLVFLGNGTLAMLCTPPDAGAETPVGERLARPYFGMHRFEWSDDESVEFHLGYGDWIRLLRATGFEVEDLIDLRPAEDAPDDNPTVPLAWARRWPCEEVWRARKR